MKKRILSFIFVFIICLPCISFGLANMVEIPLKKKPDDTTDYIVDKTAWKNWQATCICGNYLVVCNLYTSDDKVTIYVYDKEKTPSNYIKDIQTVKSVDLNNTKTSVTYKYYTYEEIEDESASQVMERKLRTKITGFIHHANSVELDSNRNILIISARTQLPIFFNFDMETGFIEQIESPFKRKCKYVDGDTTNYTCATSIAYDDVEDKFYILYGKCNLLYVATAEEFYSNTMLSHLQNYTISPGTGLKQQCKFYDGYFMYGYNHKILFYDLRNHAYGTKVTAKVAYMDTTEAELEAFSFDGDQLYISFRNQETDYGGYSIRRTNINKAMLIRYLIKFDGNEGTDGGTYNMIGMSKVSSYTGGKLPTSQRPGYKFLGWYTEKEGGTKITVNTIVEGESMYYAHWQLESELPSDEEEVSVILDENGGKKIDNNYFEIKKNTTYQYLKVNLPTPEAEDVCDKFVAWYTEPEGGTKITDSYTFTEDIILYAQYKTSHSISKVDAKASTCEDTGYVAHYSCWICGRHFIDSTGNQEVELEEGILDENDNQLFIIESLGHNLIKHEKISASRTFSGKEEYYQCSRCNKMFYDSDAQYVVENENDLIIPMIESAPIKTDEPYDIVLFWGQSNMVGYCGKYTGEDKKDTRYDYLDEEVVVSYAKKTGIDEELLRNSPTTNFVKIPQVPQTAYQYNYLANEFEELDTYTQYIGEQLIYDKTIQTLRAPSASETASIEKSYGTNIVQNFCKTYYEKTGRNIIAVHCGNAGEGIGHFLPSTDEEYSDTDKKYIYEAMKEKYNKAVELVVSQNGIVGEKLYVCFQGETNVSEGTALSRYKRLFLKVHNYLKDELGISKGIIIETSSGYGAEDRNTGVQTIHKAQVQLTEENSDILLGSSYAYDRYIPDETTYNGSYKPSSLFINASSGSKYKYVNAIKKARYSMVMTSPYIHFTSPALSQIGKETALILGEDILASHMIKGDLDEDKNITIRDVRLLLQAYINSESNTNWSEKDLIKMDMNDDQIINIMDVRFLLQLYINS